jgi:hypothetical protein
MRPFRCLGRLRIRLRSAIGQRLVKSAVPETDRAQRLANSIAFLGVPERLRVVSVVHTCFECPVIAAATTTGNRACVRRSSSRSSSARWPDSESRLPVGSSARRIGGSFARERAMATRWRGRRRPASARPLSASRDSTCAQGGPSLLHAAGVRALSSFAISIAFVSDLCPSGSLPSAGA